MFDKYIIRESGSRHTSIDADIRVHRAPTDKSVELLNEMQEKALKNILGTIKIEDNKFNYVITFYLDFRYQKTVAETQFTLNGKKYNVKCDVEDRYRNDLYGFVSELHKELSKKLAAVILEGTLESLSEDNKSVLNLIQGRII